ncbi:hypothetical protein ABIB27_003178 [Arthrobacter sp. UYEF21]
MGAVGDEAGQMRQEFVGDGAVEPFNLSAALRHAGEGMDEADVGVKADPFKVGAGEIGAVIAVEDIGQTHDGPARMFLALHGLVEGKCGLDCGRGTGEGGVAGDGAGVVIEYDGQPRACACAGGVDDLDVQLGVVALPLLVRAAGGAPVDQLEPVGVGGVAFEGDCAQPRIDRGTARTVE